MSGKTVVFGTSDLYGKKPVEGRDPVFSHVCDKGHSERFWSTGKLETALARGYDVHVVSIRWVFYDCDRWWIDLVPHDRIFHNGFAVMGRWPASQLKVRFLASWRECYDRLGVEWRDFEDFDDPLIHLVAHHSIIDGSTVPGFTA